ncbi:hypothetical protein ACE41O_21250 [Alteromonas macleodii]|jgi:hypothetical protein|uniref:Extradiol ring-cleavage dioxygenase LigAB LigA subunit domain-containing protein n=2 Tax=Alteromonas macleodii TaxID=28108 RepID=A0A126Q1Y6_ALTMA|nr:MULTISPECIES: hypothetical protein [Alteromonas]AOE07561.1 hypothetical protein [uncultured bacterium]MCG8497346.1 hypothetical protein [Enterobacterales bacterium]MEC7359894.1 hypothetical protein [Pseudomonadota bacterium]PTT99996.1 hypothetical protein DBR45_25030 [Pseudomonas sp. HMWF031]AFT75503.1 hypothetical protein AMEC673_14105 [Alteromonas macleodii str. 'English Channel 673']|tara:strand:+ start:1115 stop:1321 length:207 start_codon:yes stop_codon:yes gene_type:complete
MAKKTIVDFLVELDSNSKLMDAYKKDPVGTAEKYGLSGEDLQLIKDQDWDEVAKRFDDTSKATRVISY